MVDAAKHAWAGWTAAETLDYLLQGKFDPTNEQHQKYLAETKEQV